MKNGKPAKHSRCGKGVENSHNCFSAGRPQEERQHLRATVADVTRHYGATEMENVLH